MDKIQELQQINYGTLFVSILVFIFIIIPLFKYGWQGLEWLLVEKLGLQTKWTRKRKEEHEMIVSNAEAISNLSKAVMELTEQHKQDMEKSDKSDDEIKHRLDDFINESSVRNEQVRKYLMVCVSKIEQSIDKIHEDNLSHWETSKTARSNIDNRFQKMIDSNAERDELIKAIADGNKELLGDKIDQKFDKYTKLCGIPANEVDEFESMCQAYFKLHGNHNRKKKYDYVTKRMSVIPVETNLILEANDEIHL